MNPSFLFSSPPCEDKIKILVDVMVSTSPPCEDRIKTPFEDRNQLLKQNIYPRFVLFSVLLMSSVWQHIDETAGKESEFSKDVVSLRNIIISLRIQVETLLN